MGAKRLEWESESGKYKVLVRHFEGDPGPLVGYWVLKNGKYVPIRYRSLPEYVQNKIDELKSCIMFKA